MKAAQQGSRHFCADDFDRVAQVFGYGTVVNNIACECFSKPPACESPRLSDFDLISFDLDHFHFEAFHDGWLTHDNR